MPAVVLAAAANDVDGSLWILDDRTLGGATTRRLARLNPAGPTHEIIWEGPADPRYDAHWLVSGQNGAMVVYSSSHSVSRHVALRVEARPIVFGGSRFWLERDAPGTLAGQPIASGHGTTGYLLDSASGRIDRVNVAHTEGTQVVDPSAWF